MNNSNKRDSDNPEDFFKQQESLLQTFYRRFNLTDEKLYTRQLDSSEKNLRKNILLSELRDFNNLLSDIDDRIKEIENLQQKLLERYEVEVRNSFSMELQNRYIHFLLSSQDLQTILMEKQISFSKKRILEIKTER